MADTEQPNLTTLTVDLLSAYVSNNTIRSDDLAGLIRSTHAALTAIGDSATAQSETATEAAPAVSVRKSLGSRDHILSLIDGKPYKTLKRHLATHGLTPAEYRTRFNLPANYPMVAPNYSDHRRSVAQRLGLGRRISKNGMTSGDAAATPAAPKEEAKARGRKAAAPTTKRAPRGKAQPKEAASES